jgi:hypothetical protein
VPSDLSATINWGDGQTSAGSVQQGTSSNPSLFSLFNVFGNHTYLEQTGIGTPPSPPYQVTVTITNNNVSPPVTPSTTVATNTTISVTDAPLIAVNSPTVTIPLHKGVSTGTVTVGSFIDEDPNGKGVSLPTPLTSGDYYAQIFWGDGSSSTATGFVTSPTTAPLGPATLVNVLGVHTYANDGSYQIIVLAYDTEGVQAPSSNLAVILSTTANVTDQPASSVVVAGKTSLGTIQAANTSSTNSASSSNQATFDAALSSVANNNAVVPSGIIGLTNVGYDGSTAVGVKKNSLATTS